MMKRLFCTISLITLFCFSLLAQTSNENTTKTKNTDLKYDDPGVEIGGLIWATRNLGEPGTFVEKETDPGMLYQWNSKTGWQAYPDSLEKPPVSFPQGKVWNDKWDGNGAQSWEEQNDPCPKGWRLPTRKEFKLLLENCHPAIGGHNGYVWPDYDISKKKIGYEFVTEQKHRLFFPVGECIETGETFILFTCPKYWCSNISKDKEAWAWKFCTGSIVAKRTDQFSYIIGSPMSNGNFIRCIKK